MSSTDVIDLRCELAVADSATAETDITCIPSRFAARECGDLERIEQGDTSCCLTYAPGSGADALERLAAVPAGWRGIVRVVPADWGGEAALLPWLIDDVAAALAAIRRPLLVELDATPPPWSGLFRLGSTFTTLAIVLGAGTGTQLRLIHALCNACPNVLIESSSLPSNAIRQSVDLMGARRIVFGSGIPTQAAGHALKHLNAARLAPPERQLVLRENANDLLEGIWSP